MKKVRVTVSGKVQGVWFRSSTCDEAKKLGINGYVRNLFNGNVEFVAEGDDSKVDKIIQWAKQGPSSAYVDNIKVEVLKYDHQYTNFSVIY